MALARNPSLKAEQRDAMRAKRPQVKCRHCGVQMEFPDAPPDGCVRTRRPSCCSIECRFWSRVERRGPDECWGWKGAKHPFGYGMLSVSGRKVPETVTAHSLSWRIDNAGEVPEGMVILHSCDNPECTNPAHLVLGTHQDNVQDKVRKDRQSRGSSNGGAKLTDEQVLKIKSDPRPCRVIGAEHGVSESLISSIKRGERWKHLP